MFLPTQEHRTRYSQRIKICDAGFLSLHLNLRFNKDVSIDIDILNTRQHAFVSVLSRVVSVELGISSVKFTCYQSKVLTEHSATSKTSSVSELFYFICYLLLCRAPLRSVKWPCLRKTTLTLSQRLWRLLITSVDRFVRGVKFEISQRLYSNFCKPLPQFVCADHQLLVYKIIPIRKTDNLSL